MRRWTGAVTVAGALAVVVTLIIGRDGLATRPITPIALAALVAVACGAVVEMRLRSTMIGTCWTDAAILVVVVVGPPTWAPVCVAVGVVAAKLGGRVSATKAAYHAGMEALAATAGLLVALALDIVHTPRPLAHLPALAAVALTVTLVQNSLSVPALALAAGVSRGRILRTDATLRWIGILGKFLVAALAIQVIHAVPLLIAVVLLALCLHMLYASRMRSRIERAAWQRLARATDELNDSDLDQVLAAAVTNAASLFAADEVEVVLRTSPTGPLLVRGDAEGVRWSGPPGRAPARRPGGRTVTSRLPGPVDAARPPGPVDSTPEGRADARSRLGTDLGEVRLYFRGRLRLTDREKLILRTFVAALRTALHNAQASAEAERLTRHHTYAATHDLLTGLANRRRLRDYGDEVLARPSRDGIVAMAVLDLDRFKDVNETLGHLAGDRVLAEVSRRLGRMAAVGDLVARLDGDEFAVLLVGLESEEQVLVRVQAILATLDPPAEIDEMRVRVPASAGVALASVDEEPLRLDELLRRADVALNEARRTGRRLVSYDPSRDPADVDSLRLGGELARAVADREFTLEFQPVVDLASGEMIAAEALARWHHPQRGDLNPWQFIPAVQRSGLLAAFTESVLDQAVLAAMQWRAVGVPAPVAVNAAPRSLLDPDFARLVLTRLDAHRYAPADLIIDLTETLDLIYHDAVRRVLRELRAAGVRLALDNFGTGYSSLAMLAQVPIDQIKIDHGFVASLQSTPEADAIVRSAVKLGHSLGLAVVAEGIERPEQRRVLSEMGCRAGQGHLFARPMPLAALLEALRTGVDGVPGLIAAPLRPDTDGPTPTPRADQATPGHPVTPRPEGDPAGEPTSR